MAFNLKALFTWHHFSRTGFGFSYSSMTATSYIYTQGFNYPPHTHMRSRGQVIPLGMHVYVYMRICHKRSFFHLPHSFIYKLITQSYSPEMLYALDNYFEVST